MRVTLWGTRGSLAAPGPETTRYGGNTACVEVRGDDGTVLVLDAGTGIRRLGTSLAPGLRRVDILLSHLHMDHVQGLGFFEPLYEPDLEVHIWGPASTTQSLRARLLRYLSPPLFPVPLRDLPCRLVLHEVPGDEIEVGSLSISSALICHPGPTVGYRITGPSGTVAYLSDHEPALGTRGADLGGTWTSGFALARQAHLLIHDAQYSDEEYASRVGWGHSSMRQALAFAGLAGVRRLVPFHHDPAHTDDDLDDLTDAAVRLLQPDFEVTPGLEGLSITLGDD